MSFLQIPNALFINKKYRKMSIEAKLAYGLLLRRMQLSNLNGWINEDNEVFVIYTREQMAAELCVGYKKSVAAFHELVKYDLILEKRRGRGLANHIYISKAEIPEPDAAEYTDNLRYVEMTCQTPNIPDSHDGDEAVAYCNVLTCDDISEQDLPIAPFKSCQSDTSKPAETTVQDLSFSPSSNKDSSYKNFSKKECSHSIYHAANPIEDSEEIDRIIENCELENFESDVAAVFRHVVERMYYSSSLKVGDAIFPQAKVRSYLCLLNYYKVDLAYQKIKQNVCTIRNPVAYVTILLFNCICEEDAEFMLDAFLHQRASYKP